ncbi:M23 family metallopeptidase [Desulfuromonas sp. AOP6]|uniref:M23 family metallopeptidase n=1 Tax=Desulfuromonas sp. AOP6 TaxID=1566351 RepID=UPI00126BD92D|nr:M23 family metallopeptidase [Desulfuromonas sp. AOP6]BCA79315.1 peptidase M24 [Desulfuromonas sp. AOP6]
MNRDFNPPKSYQRSRANKRPRFFWVLLLAGLVLTPLLLINRPTVSPLEAHTNTDQEITTPTFPEITKEVIEGTVRPGDSVTTLLGEHLSPAEILHLDRRCRDIFPLSKICVEQPYKLILRDGAFESFEYEINADDQLLVRRAEDSFDVARVPIEYTVRIERVGGIITSSLFEAVTDSGEGPELAMTLADIFAWDIDFILDIREGDSFQAILEKRFREGSFAGYGRVLAAQFTNQGNLFQAFLFQDGQQNPSYYDAEGKSVRKAFLKAPLSFSRISSGFSMKRFHPITKTWKSHPAIDYAAPVGTPIKSVGDGTIIAKGYTRANGNYIKIRHNGSYESIYLHMNGFARGMRNGRHVSQGQVIGYVGSTGLATGPHLCFRMRKNGAPINPARIKAPASAPVSAENMAQFQALIAPHLASFQNRDISTGSKMAAAAQDTTESERN